MSLNTTAIGKTVKTGLWIVSGYIVTTLIAKLAGYHWSASLTALGVPSIVNLVLYSMSQFFDSAIPNFKTSKNSVAPSIAEPPIA
jgi:hypothetical protein